MFPILKHTHWLSTLFGLSIFSVKTLSLKPMALLYILFLLIPVVYNIRGLLTWVLIPTELPKTAVFFITQNDSLVYTMALLSWTLLLVRYMNHMETIREIFDISSQVESAGIVCPLDHLQNMQSLYTAVLLLLLCIKYSLDYVVDTGDSHWIGFYLADATNNTVILQFINFLWLLKEFYSVVNNKLSKLLQEGLVRNSSYIFKLAHFRTPIRSVFSPKVRNSHPVNSETNVDLLIKDLRLILNSVFSLSQIVNSIYSLQLLLYMANFIVEFTVSLYMLYYTGVYKVTDKDLADPLFWAYISCQVMVIVSDSFQIVIMINSSEDVTDESCATALPEVYTQGYGYIMPLHLSLSSLANHTAVLIHKLMNEDLPTGTMEEVKYWALIQSLASTSVVLHNKHTGDGVYTNSVEVAL
ncbi:hypothetical protein J6590_073985 [Homalodisca vitripennis]|nr:hypothetical protein J6590_073985 [Homalodisca vitripennis]